MNNGADHMTTPTKAPKVTINGKPNWSPDMRGTTRAVFTDDGQHQVYPDFKPLLVPSFVEVGGLNKLVVAGIDAALAALGV